MAQADNPVGPLGPNMRPPSRDGSPTGPAQQPAGHISPESQAAQLALSRVNVREATAEGESSAIVAPLMNVPEPTQLWLNGAPVIVSSSQVDALLNSGVGFARSPYDLSDLSERFAAHGRAAIDAVQEFIREVQTKKLVDTSADSQALAANEAIRELLVQWQRIHDTVFLVYPVAQDEPHVIELPNGAQFAHDASQVAVVRQDGQARAVPPDEVPMYREMGFTVPGGEDLVRRAVQVRKEREAPAPRSRSRSR